MDARTESCAIHALHFSIHMNSGPWGSHWHCFLWFVSCINIHFEITHDASFSFFAERVKEQLIQSKKASKLTQNCSHLWAHHWAPIYIIFYKLTEILISIGFEIHLVVGYQSDCCPVTWKASINRKKSLCLSRFIYMYIYLSGHPHKMFFSNNDVFEHLLEW